MKGFVITTIKIIVSVGLLWFLTHTSKLDFSLLPEMLRSPFWLICTLSLYFVIIAISSWRWHQLNEAQGIQLAYKHTILPTYLGVAFNNLLPGGVGGDFFRFYFLRKKVAAKKSAVMLSVFCDRITGLLGIFIIVCLMASAQFSLFSEQKYILDFILCCIALCGLLILAYLASLLLPRKMGVSEWLSIRFAGKEWLSPILSLLEAIRLYRNNKQTIAECLIASVIIQILIALTCMLIAKMMHFPTLSFFDYVIAIGITQIVNLIPIAPGGFGVGEIAFAKILMLLNPGTSASYATVFLAYRILGILTYLPGIGVFLFDKQLLNNKTPFHTEQFDTV